jgi:hypothetical protein
MTTPVRYISLEDVFARYGGSMSRWTIRERARRGLLPSLKLPGTKKILFREDWLQQYDEGCDLERHILRQRGQSNGRVVRPKPATRKQAA